MNGAQQPGVPYPNTPPPPPDVVDDPLLGPMPRTWRKGVYGYGDDPRRKSPALAAILSLMPGLGQVYVGYYQQGFAHMFIAGFTIFLLANSDHTFGIRPLVPFLGFFLGFFWLYNVIDAYRRASLYNLALAGMGPGEMPQDIKLPRAGGSMAGGVALILLGALLLANTVWGVSLDWLDQWWPMAFVLLGGWLVYASASAKRSAPPAAQTEQPTGR